MRELMLQQLDRRLDHVRHIRNYIELPQEGWVRTIRKALGMTSAALAKRLKVNRSRVIKIENSELKGALTLSTLQNVAATLHCDLVYMLLPKQSLESIVHLQAEKIAKQLVDRIATSMALEAQNLTIEQKALQQKKFMVRLLSEPKKYLWNEDDNDNF